MGGVAYTRRCCLRVIVVVDLRLNGIPRLVNSWMDDDWVNRGGGAEAIDA
jgi:hypothetical protein